MRLWPVGSGRWTDGLGQVDGLANTAGLPRATLAERTKSCSRRAAAAGRILQAIENAMPQVWLPLRSSPGRSSQQRRYERRLLLKATTSLRDTGRSLRRLGPAPGAYAMRRVLFETTNAGFGQVHPIIVRVEAKQGTGRMCRSARRRLLLGEASRRDESPSRCHRACRRHRHINKFVRIGHRG